MWQLYTILLYKSFHTYLFTSKECCSFAKSWLTLCDPMDCNTPGSSVLHYLLEFAQIHVPWVSDAILTISSSATPFSFCPQSFLASGSFPMSGLSISGGQSIAASASVLLMSIQGWFPLGLTVLLVRDFGFISKPYHLISPNKVTNWLLHLKRKGSEL